MSDKAIIDITCWAVSLGGEHYTGRIGWSGRCSTYIDVEHNMSSRMAAALNKKDGCSYYRSGDETGRFETESSLIKKGIELALARHPDTKYVLVGGGSSAQPIQMVWCADESLMSKANKIWKEMDAL